MRRMFDDNLFCDHFGILLHTRRYAEQNRGDPQRGWMPLVASLDAFSSKV